jgi:hypothetical protein
MSKYGWKKSVTELPNLHCYSAIQIPQVIDLTKDATEVVNQLQVGRCTGTGIGGAVSAVLTQLKVNKNTMYVAPDWIYNGERKLEGTLNYDGGGQPADGYRWIGQHGIVPYQYMPITPTLNTTDPMLLQGYAVMLQNYVPVHLDTHPDTVLSELLDAMAQGHYVTQGAAFFSAWESVGADGICPFQIASQAVAGGHETYYVGADQSKQLFRLRNSWGKDYAFKGDYFITFDQVKVLASMGMDLAYPCFTGISHIAPPVPVKTGCAVFELLHKMRYNQYRISEGVLN